LQGCDFYDVTRQERTGFRFARLCPTQSYARKNIGYLIAMAEGASRIVETDDDNISRVSFWDERSLEIEAPRLANGGWVNVYRYFSELMTWPRGLPAHCSFRMTDIWRSFVAQRIAWENGWSVLFHEATVRQDRNAHDLMRDFQDEVSGYLHNRAIVEALSHLSPTWARPARAEPASVL
ncbi:MAG: STELLO glycosyltransferase family protein, partial [Chthoniobacterales bacterium]